VGENLPGYWAESAQPSSPILLVAVSSSPWLGARASATGRHDGSHRQAGKIRSRPCSSPGPPPSFSSLSLAPSLLLPPPDQSPSAVAAVTRRCHGQRPPFAKPTSQQAPLRSSPSPGVFRSSRGAPEAVDRAAPHLLASGDLRRHRRPPALLSSRGPPCAAR
jgi:hypothetical protein